MRIFLTLFLIFISWFQAHAQVGFGISVEPGLASRQEKMTPKSRMDSYAVEISTYFGIAISEINKLFSEGFGRKEIIKLITISRKAHQPLSEIIKLRKRKTTLSELSKKYNLNYAEIKNETEEIFRTITYNIQKNH